MLICHKGKIIEIRPRQVLESNYPIDSPYLTLIKEPKKRGRKPNGDT